MKRLTISLCFLLASISIFSQTVSTKILPTQTVVDSSKIKADKLAKSHLKHRKFIQAADTLSKGDYLLSMDRVNDNLIDIRDSAKLGFVIVNLKHQIEDITIDFNRMQANFRERHIRMSVKNLTLYRTFANELDLENDAIMDRLQMLYKRVYHAKLRVKTVLKDSIFKKIYADSLLRNAYEYKLIPLEKKWAGTDSITKLNIDSINILKVTAVDNSINLTNLMSRLDRKLEIANNIIFTKELPILWQSFTDSNNTKTVSYWDSEQKAFYYYVNQTWNQRIYLLIAALLLFLWLFMKRRLLKNIRHQKEKYEYLKLKYLASHPVISILIVSLSLMPFFDVLAPISFISIEYFLLLSLVSILIFKNGNNAQRFNWSALCVLFVVIVLTNLFATPTSSTRILMLVLQLLVIVFTFINYKNADSTLPFSKWIKLAALAAILFSVIALLTNIFGRFTLSCFFGTTAIVAITLAVVLSIFIETILEIILIQLLGSRENKGIDSPFDGSLVLTKITMPIFFIAILIWVISLTSNLNIYYTVSDFIIDTLTLTRTVGSISFKLISVVMFFVIIWVAHILQRLLSFLFGEIGSEAEETNIVVKGQQSRLLITRLLVLIGGYLLAIAASGLPIDKLTFLLGALGVGIGMGLQNVVNNFVSGIILIFDGSLQIGDEIEVSGQAGKVKEIGLRASTLNTADGAEVIIPNGNILSQNIVNWTFSNNQKRVTVEFSLKGTELDANQINEIINETIQKIPHVIAKRKPVILFNKVSAEGCTITVRFWSTISKVDSVKSDALLQLNAAFSSNNIGFV